MQEVELNGNRKIYPKIQISDSCIVLVKTFEGFRADAYKCPAGVWTIGYGHTEDVKLEIKLQNHIAVYLTSQRVGRTIVKVDKLLKKVSQNQF